MFLLTKCKTECYYPKYEQLLILLSIYEMWIIKSYNTRLIHKNTLKLYVPYRKTLINRE